MPAARLAVALAAVLLVTACADKRISVGQLRERERTLSEAAPVRVEPTALALTDQHPYRVRAGDILSIRMIGLSEERYAVTALDLRVHDDGLIIPPVVGPIKVAGLTLSEVEQALLATHVPRVVKDLSVFVQLVEPQATTVLVLGAVPTPGFVKLPENERNALYALALAGGFGATATAGGFSNATSGRIHVKPIRPEREEVTYDLNDVNDVRRALTAPPLESGDIVAVETADQSALYVAGLVNRAGPILIPPQSSLSVLRAVMAAGGLRDYLDVKEATLMRTLENGETVHVKLDLGGMLAGRTPDLALKAGDILHVPYTVDTFAQEWFFRNMLPGPFNVGLHYDPLAQYNAERALRDRTTSGDVLRSIRTSLGTAVPGAFIPPAPAPGAGR